MANEVIDTSIDGLFDKTSIPNGIAGGSEGAAAFLSGKVSANLFTSLVDIPAELSDLFDKIRPIGLKNIITEPDLLGKAASAGVSAGDFIKTTLAKAPKDIDSFGDIFDDGTFTFEDADNLLDRLSGTLPTSSLDNMSQTVFERTMKLSKDVTQALNADGNYFNKLESSTMLSKNLGLATGNKDQGVLGGYVAALSSSLAKTDGSTDIVSTIDSLSDMLGMDDTTSGIVKRLTTFEVAKNGSFKQTKDLTESLPDGTFSNLDKKNLASSLMRNYTRSESIQDDMLTTESNAVTTFVSSLDSDWNKTSVNDESIVDIEKINNSSTDFKELLIVNDSTSFQSVLSTASFI